MGKIQRYLMVAGAALMAAFFFTLKMIRIGKQAAKAETLTAQRDIEERTQANLKQEIKQSNENNNSNNQRISVSDYRGFNDSK